MRVNQFLEFACTRRRAAAIFALSAAEAVGAIPSSSPEQIEVQDSLGLQRLAVRPKRIAALQWDLLENLITLGVVPAAAADLSAWPIWVRKPELPAGIVDVGTRAEPNIELIAALKPDLILIGPTQLDLKPALEAIAPVLCFENFRASDTDGEAAAAMTQLVTLGALLGREKQAAAFISRINERLEALGRQIRRAFGFSPQVQVIRFSSLTTAFIYTPNSIADYVIRRMGLAQPLQRPPADYGLTQIRIRELKGLETAFVIYVRPFAQESRLLSSILWQAMPFVRKERAAPAASYWSHGGAASILTTAESICSALLTLAPGSAERHSS